MWVLGDERLKSSPTEGDQEVLVGGKLNLSQPCALAARMSDPGVHQDENSLWERVGSSHCALCCCGLTSTTVFSFGFSGANEGEKRPYLVVSTGWIAGLRPMG